MRFSRRVLAWISGVFLMCGCFGLIASIIGVNEASIPLGITALGFAGICVLVCKTPD